MEGRNLVAVIQTVNTGTRRMDPEVAKDDPSVWNTCLLQIASHGDQSAFQQLFNKFAPLIKAFAARQPVSSELTSSIGEELVQETMVKVWQKAASFNPEKASASTWIFTIARNTRIDLLRKNTRHYKNRQLNDSNEDSFDIDDIWIENDKEDVFNQLARQRNSEMLHTSMKQLPEEQAFILKKVYLEDKSHTEIAEELNLPLGTVKSRVRLALSKLRLSVDR